MKFQFGRVVKGNTYHLIWGPMKPYINQDQAILMAIEYGKKYKVQEVYLRTPGQKEHVVKGLCSKITLNSDYTLQTVEGKHHMKSLV